MNVKSLFDRIKINQYNIWIIFLIFIFYFFLLAFTAFFPLQSWASGVQPGTSVVIINEAQKGGSINVTNTEKVPVLLYTKVVDLPDDLTPKLIVTQPVVRLEPGQTQRVRFVLNSNRKLQHEHIKRVYFEGITAQTSNNSQLNVTVRQDLPVIIIPTTQVREQDVWKKLNWSLSGQTLKVTNTGKQVARLVPQLKLLPAGITLSLSKSYILPGETLSVSSSNYRSLGNQLQVQFSPVTRYGFDAGLQKVDLNKK